MEDSIFNQNNPQGERVRKLLKSLNIKSPDVSGRIEIKPGLWVVPKKEIKTAIQLEAFINKWLDIVSINKPSLQKGGLTKQFK